MRKEPGLKCSIIIQNLLKKLGEEKCNFCISEVFLKMFLGKTFELKKGRY